MERLITVEQNRFNSQPPEGGWRIRYLAFIMSYGFNSQPPEGGWLLRAPYRRKEIVSTHSRPKAAGPAINMLTERDISFNSQPPEGGWLLHPNCKQR